MCILCSYKCYTCAELRTKCTECAENRITIPFCGCSFGFYDNGSSPLCLECAPGCNLCNGPLPNECTTCSGNRLNFPTCSCSNFTYQN